MSDIMSGIILGILTQGNAVSYSRTHAVPRCLGVRSGAAYP